MTYAHQGVELRQLPGLPTPHAPALADVSFKGGEEPHPVLLTRKGTDALIQVEHMLDDADHALSAERAPAGSLGALDDGNNVTGNRIDAFATAAERGAAASPRGD